MSLDIASVLLGWIAGSTLITAFWILDLKRVYQRNETKSWEAWRKAQA